MALRFSSTPVPAFVVAGAASAWLALLVGAPYLATHAPGTDIRFATADLVYRVAHLVCHQRAERSFHAWGLQLPVCARCLGLYASAAVGAFAAAVAGWGIRSTTDRRQSERGRVRLAVGREGDRLVLAALPTIFSVGLEAVGLWSQAPVIRFIAALPLGLVVGHFVAVHAGEVMARLARAPRR